MKRGWLFGVALALAMSVGVAAQHSDHAAPAMLTGCLAPLNQNGSSVAGTTGTTATTTKTSRHAPERFTLLNPKAGPAAAPSNGDVTPSADAQVLLQGANLKQYAGHNVEVRGQFVDSKTAASHEERSGHDEHNLRIFRVASVSNVDGACSTSGR